MSDRKRVLATVIIVGALIGICFVVIAQYAIADRLVKAAQPSPSPTPANTLPPDIDFGIPEYPPPLGTPTVVVPIPTPTSPTATNPSSGYVNVCGTRDGVPGCVQYDDAYIEIQKLLRTCVNRCNGGAP